MGPIRKALSSDIDAIDKCNRIVLPENYDRKTYESLFEFEGFVSFVVEEDDKIVGYVMAFLDKDSKKKIIGHIMSIGILKDYRRRGYGRKLLELAENDLKERFKIKCITLHVRKKNKAAYKLYCKMHYGRIKKVKDYYEDNEDAYLMKKVFV